jgi:hypothetical protein
MEEIFSTFFSRIDKVLKDNGLVKKDGKPNYAKAEQKSGMAGTVLAKAAQREGQLSEYNKEKFLRTFHVKREWLESGKGEIYEKNPTPAIKNDDPGATEEKKLIATLERAVAIIEKDNENLWRQNTSLLALVDKLTSGRLKSANPN